MIKLNFKYIAEDQYGQVVWIREHPRKELMAHCSRLHAKKMYIGDGEHIGYIIAGSWFSVFQLAPLHAGD